MGAGEAFALISIGQTFGEMGSRAKILAISAATMMAGLGFGVTVNLPTAVAIIISEFTFLLAIFFAGKSHRLKDSGEEAGDLSFVELAAQEEHCPRGFNVTFCYFSFVYGTALSLGVGLSSDIASSFILCLAICLASLILIFNALVLHGRVETSRTLQVLLSTVTLTLLPLPFSGDSIKMLFLIVLIAGFTAFDMLSISLLGAAEATNSSEAPALQRTVVSRLSNAAGIFLGWTVGSSFYLSGMLYDAAFTAFSLAVIIVLVLFLTFMSNPSGTDGGLREGPTTPEPEPIDACMEFSAQFRLSPRESEVLVLLARGRDVVYISKALDISPNTAKSHIHKIYQKSDIHNRQDLIDYVEGYRSNSNKPESSTEKQP